MQALKCSPIRRRGYLTDVMRDRSGHAPQVREDEPAMRQVNEQWLDRVRERAAWAWPLRAKEACVDVATYERLATQKIRGWSADAEVRLRITEEQFIAFLRSGSYQTLATTGTSGGTTNLAIRRAVEDQIFGIPRSADAEARPIYGYLEGSDEQNALPQWGPVVLVVDHSVRERATFILGDSVDSTIQGRHPLLAPEPLQAPCLLAASSSQNVLQAATLADACSQHGRYAEVQIYRGLDRDDIARVICIAGWQPSAESARLLNAYGLAVAR